MRSAEPSTTAVDTEGSIRRSGALLLGQVMALGIGLAIQVLVVRYLSKDDYGAFAWSISVVMLIQSVLPLGLDKANARFLALYDEARDYGRLAGFIALELTVIVGLGAAVASLTIVFAEQIQPIAPSREAAVLLAVLIVLAPIQAVDGIVTDMFAVFGSAWSVFLRRYVVHPLLRLVVVLLLVLGERSTLFLAAGYVVAACLGLSMFLVLLWRLFKNIGLTAHIRAATPVAPWREVLRFCGPLFLTSFVAVATTEFAAVALGHTSGSEAVASFRAVQPFAALNLVVLLSFSTLFVPTLSRLAARTDTPAMRDLYWRTASWIAVLTFPVMAITTAFAPQLTVLALGERYSGSGPVLAVLAIGYYLNAALGFNGLTVQILGRGRWVLVTTLVTLATAVASISYLSSRYQAMGAAVAVLLTLVVHNALKQSGLGFGLGIGIWRGEHVKVLGQAVGLVALLAIANLLVPISLWVALPTVALLWLVLLRSTRETLRLSEAFPEIRRIPLLQWLF